GSLKDVRHPQQDIRYDECSRSRPRPLDRGRGRPSRLRRLAPMTHRSPDELLAYDREHVWHPYTSMTDPVLTRLVTGADGVRLQLPHGRRVVGGTSRVGRAL